MTSPHKRRYRRVDKTGRSKGSARFVKLDHYLLDSEAYRSMRALPRAVYTLLRRRFNGSNNGEILCSIRDIVHECLCSKDGAAAALEELVLKGFVKCAQHGSFHFKLRHAPKWILTEEAYREQLPTKEFMRWRAPKENHGPETRTAGPGMRTDVPKEGPNVVEFSPKKRTDGAV
jgi:hypothetical protein